MAVRAQRNGIGNDVLAAVRQPYTMVNF